MDPTPSNPDWWETEIRDRAMARRSQYLPYSGKLVVSGGLVLLSIALTYVILTRLSLRHLPVIAVALGVLGFLGWNFQDILLKLDDPYHTQFYQAALAVIEAETSAHEMALKQVANTHLEQVTDSADRSAAEDALRTCAERLAETYDSQTADSS